MLVKLEYDEDRFGPGGELFGWFDGDDFMSPLKAQLFIKPFGKDNPAKHSFGWGVEIVRLGALGVILKVRDRHIVSQREILGPEERG